MAESLEEALRGTLPHMARKMGEEVATGGGKGAEVSAGALTAFWNEAEVYEERGTPFEQDLPFWGLL